MRAHSLPFLPVLLFAAVQFASAEEVSVATEEKTLDFSDRSNPPPFYPSGRVLDLVAPGDDAPGQSGLGEGVIPLHESSITIAGKPRRILLARDAESEEHPNRLAVDADGDGSFSEDEIYPLVVTERRNRAGDVAGYFARHTDLALPVGDRSLVADLSLSRRGEGEWSLRFNGRWYREAAFKIGAIDYVAILVDADLDGAYGGEKDLWLVRAAGPIKRPVSTFGLAGAAEGQFLDGARFALESIEGASLKLSMRAADGPDPADEAAARHRVERTWFERFDREREQFVAQRVVDTKRPRATEPIRWRKLTFAQAKEAAKKEGKLLFVDVLAFWCVWCYRMDYYTYPDAEVAGLLNEHFIAVKVIQEQDHAGDYARVREELGARGIPAMGIWTPAGELQEKISGWRKPADFAALLAAAAGKDAR